MDWRIYYEDGSFYDPTMGPWEDAPSDGVICVNVRDRTRAGEHSFTNSGYAPQRGTCPTCNRGMYNDVYVMRPGSDEPYATHNDGPFRRWFERNHPEIDVNKYIKHGLQVPQEVWASVMERACADVDFPKNSPRRRASDFKGHAHPDDA